MITVLTDNFLFSPAFVNSYVRTDDEEASEPVLLLTDVPIEES